MKKFLFLTVLTLTIVANSAKAYYYLPAVSGKIENQSDLNFAEKIKIVVEIYSENEGKVLTSLEAPISKSGEFHLPKVKYGNAEDTQGNPFGMIPWRQHALVKLVHEEKDTDISTTPVRKDSGGRTYADLFKKMTLIQYPVNESLTVFTPSGLNLKTYMDDALRETGFLDESQYVVYYSVIYHYQIPIIEEPIYYQGKYISLFVTERNASSCGYPLTDGIEACLYPKKEVSHTFYAATNKNGKSRYLLTNGTVDLSRPFVLNYKISLNVQRTQSPLKGVRVCYMNIDGADNSWEGITLNGNGFSFIGPMQISLNPDLDSVREKIKKANWCKE
ncbi:MAG: hypothetical protein V4596_01835 [Bdellovibrionota bacterium]